MSEARNRFLSFVKKGDSCWMWTGATERNGYGAFKLDKRKTSAHRAAYRLFVGEIDDHAVVHHKCGDRACVNPSHLQMCSQAENMAEMFARQAYEARIKDLEKEVKRLRKLVKKGEAE